MINGGRAVHADESATDADGTVGRYCLTGVRDMLCSNADSPQYRSFIFSNIYSNHGGGRERGTGNLRTAAAGRGRAGELGTGPAPLFWTGSSNPRTVANYWRQRLARIAEKAGVEDFRTHRLRDTFATELLLADVSMEDVSVLLGDSSVQTTELYGDPAQDRGGSCNGSPGPPPGAGGQIRFERASP